MNVLNIRLNCRGSVRSQVVCSPGSFARLLRAPGVGELVGPEARLAGPAVHQGIGEAGDVAGGLPDLGVHQDGGVEAFDVVAGLDHRAPPAVLDVALELDAERAVVPDRAEPAIDLGGLEDEAAPLGEGNQLVHYRSVGHQAILRSRGRWAERGFCFVVLKGPRSRLPAEPVPRPARGTLEPARALLRIFGMP